MEIEEALIAHLKTHAGLAALIGRRVWFDESDDKTLPHVIGIDVSDVKNHLLSGQDTSENPIKQFSIHAASRESAKAVAKQFKAALSDYHGTMSGLEVEYIQLINEFCTLYRNDDGTLQEVILDLEYQIFYERR